MRHFLSDLDLVDCILVHIFLMFWDISYTTIQRFGYCGTGVYIFLNFSKIFVSVHFFYRLFLIDFNHGIRLGHCVPRPCRNLGLKQFLTHGGIRDTSEKIQSIKKWVGYEGVKVLSCKNFEVQNQFS